jgi:hypothetical protein
VSESKRVAEGVKNEPLTLARALGIEAFIRCLQRAKAVELVRLVQAHENNRFDHVHETTQIYKMGL